MSDDLHTTRIIVLSGANRQSRPGRVEENAGGNPCRQPSSRPKYVYIVDDESSVRQAMSFALRTAGYVVRPFASGRDFLEATEMLAPGCVLLDLRMPELGGFAVLGTLGNNRRKFPCIAMTGYGDVHTAVEVMKCGARDFLEKPFTDLILLRALEEVFSNFDDEVNLESARGRAMDLVASLSRRERDTLRELVDGLSNKAVAFRLGLSVRTVEMHRANLMDRLGVKSIAEAIRLAILAGVDPL